MLLNVQYNERIITELEFIYFEKISISKNTTTNRENFIPFLITDYYTNMKLAIKYSMHSVVFIKNNNSLITLIISYWLKLKINLSTKAAF